MKYTTLFLLSLFLSISLFADEADSLIIILHNSSDEKKIEIQCKLVDLFLESEPDSALYYAKQALELSEKNDNEYQKTLALKNISSCLSSINDFENALLNINQADSLSSILLSKEKTDGMKLLRGDVLSKKGRILENLGRYSLALKNYQLAADFYDDIKDTEGLAMVYNDIGYVHYSLGSNQKAFFYFNKVHNIFLETQNLTGIATALNNLGTVYDISGKKDSALFFYFESIEINKELGNSQIVAYLYHNIGLVYEKDKNFDEALKYYEQSLKLTEEINDIFGIVNTLTRIAVVNRNKGNFDMAVNLFKKGLEKANSIKSLENQRNILFELYTTYEINGHIDSAFRYYKNYITLKDSIFNTNMLEKIAELEIKYNYEKQAQQIELLKKNEKLKEKEAKIRNIILFTTILILVFIIIFTIILSKNFKNKKEANKLLTQQNAEILNKKEEIKTQSEELEKTNQELEKLSIVARETDNSVIITDEKGIIKWVNLGFERIYGFSIDEFIQERSNNIFEASTHENLKDKIKTVYTQKKSITYESSCVNKDGKKVFMQTTVTPLLDAYNNINKLIIIESDIQELKIAQKEILQKNVEIEAKNNQINASIRYALNIQSAMLPPKFMIDKHFDNFIIYRPKDIVSGDFYWFSNPIKNVFFVATVDCTGHGVPGAFMSMISNMLLNEIVNQNKIFSTKKILTKLKKSIEISLRQKETNNNDGLDIVLIKINKINKKIIFSGAKLPLFIFKNKDKKVQRIKGDIAHIGGVYNKQKDIEFSEKEIIYEKNDTIYLATDGFIDQNNEYRKRFGTKMFYKLLTENGHKSTFEQKQIFENTLDKWQGNSSQRDDITVIGIKPE